MRLAWLIARELAGMFIDDEFLALAILVVVAVSALFAFELSAPSVLTGGVLVIGCVAVLLSSIVKASKKH